MTFCLQTIGVIGMGVMGKNLAFNIESRGYSVSIYNRSRNKTDLIILDNPNKNIFPCYSIKEFVLSLKRPRRIFLMITAGIYVDHVIKSLLPYLNEGDILIDGGNSFYQDTMNRNVTLSKIGINFIGLGISGGEKGALTGPSLMPGGQQDAYKIIETVLSSISARINNEICMDYIGPNGSGHYVKMIHNGIEYGDMQLISEVYFLFKKVLCLTNKELGSIFTQWNEGELNSYLIEITSVILNKVDENNLSILDYVLDVSEDKGTGSWTAQNALKFGIPLNIITASVFSRYLSKLKNQRVQASKLLFGPNQKFSCENKLLFIEKVRKALFFSKVILYAQGFYQLKIASDKYHWDLNYKKIALIFRAGCIIRTSFLKKIADIYSNNPKIVNLLLDPYCVTVANNYQQMLRDVVLCGLTYGVPMPALLSAISYYDSFRSEKLPANLIQAQRDCFGSHTYMRIDKKGIFHTEWI